MLFYPFPDARIDPAIAPAWLTIRFRLLQLPRDSEGRAITT